ncbi:MAG TPA: riboflavin biosynthesis protein RibF [Clostridia bacterium]|nr:riboflavin biosynthesis protein RibF [Clostridia bacterium]
MKNINIFKGYDKPISLALGFFDCMHLGHRKILDTVKETAGKTGSETALLTFENNYFKTLGKNEKLVYTFSERENLLQSLSLDVLISCIFDQNFMNLTSDEFLFILDKFDIRAIVCGFDYRFGKDKADVYKLEKYCISKRIHFHIQSPVTHDGVKISATEIRKALNADRIDLANFYLGDKFFIFGEVTEGRGVGRALGFPTANITFDDDKLLPLGVFAAETVLDGVKYNAVVNIGGKPTFGIDKPTVEAYISNYNADLYGKKIKISLLKYLRPIHKFSDEKELAKQIQKDLSEVLL